MLEENLPLQIDEDKALAQARIYLNRIAPSSKNPKFVTGISGGVDSALLATLVVHLYGPAALKGYYLYDRDSAPRMAQNASALAEKLGIELLRISIEPQMHSQGIYRSVHMRLTARWAVLNRILHQFYSLLAGETPFMTSLRIGGAQLAKDDRRNKLFRTMCAEMEMAFNARHIYRREILERESTLHDAVLLGAANRSEWNLGWFVKGGVDDVRFQPLIGLYKTQVRQLGRGLGLSKGLITQKPSPDMLKGITDEFAIGIPYESVDLILDYLEGGVPPDILRTRRLPRTWVSRVAAMQQFSSWKRGDRKPELPIDGGPGSILRVDRQAK